jgi:hypothetical protein
MSGGDTYTPLVFISHSAKDPLARELLSRIYSGIHTEYEVLLDRKRLQPNNEWRKELHTWLGLCQGAVLLLSEDAVKNSKWVKKEATILGYRREMDDKFILVPILVPPVTADTLKQSDFEPLALDAIQMASGKADEVVTQVLDALEPLRGWDEAKAPLKKVEMAVAKVLSELAKEDRKAVMKAAAMLGKRLPWKTDEDYGRQLARVLISADLDVVIDVLIFIADNISGSGKKLASVVDTLATFWVDPDAVTELPRMHKRPRRQRAISVNGVKCPFTAKSYIQRASLDFEWISATVNALDKGYEELPLENKVEFLIEQIQKQIVPWLGFDEDAKPTPQEIEERLCNFEADEPIFIFVPRDFDENLLAELRVQLEWFTFFMLRSRLAPTAPGLTDWQIVCPEPELPDGRDRDFESLIGTKKSKLLRMK